MSNNIFNRIKAIKDVFCLTNIVHFLKVCLKIEPYYSIRKIIFFI